MTSLAGSETGSGFRGIAFDAPATTPAAARPAAAPAAMGMGPGEEEGRVADDAKVTGVGAGEGALKGIGLRSTGGLLGAGVAGVKRSTFMGGAASRTGSAKGFWGSANGFSGFSL